MDPQIAGYARTYIRQDQTTSSRGETFKMTHRDNGFTLIELLVVAAIIAVLAGLLFPVVGRVMETSGRVKCISNLKQIFTAAQLYSTENQGTVLPGFIRNDSTGVTEHWNLHLLEFYNYNSGVQNDPLDRADFSCPEWKKVSATYTNWNWGFGINEKPLYNGPGSTSAENQNTRITIQSNGNITGTVVRNVSLTHASKRAYFLCSNVWNVNNVTVLSDAGVNRHGKGRCNVMFFDGHAETLGPAAVAAAVINPGNL